MMMKSAQYKDGNLCCEMDLNQPGVECMGVQVDQNNRTVSILLRDHACDVPWDFELRLPEHVAAELGRYLQAPHDVLEAMANRNQGVKVTEESMMVPVQNNTLIEVEDIDDETACLRFSGKHKGLLYLHAGDTVLLPDGDLPPEWKAVRPVLPAEERIPGETVVVEELTAEQPVCHGIEPPQHFSFTRCLEVAGKALMGSTSAYWETTEIEQPADQREAILARVKADGFFRVERDDVRDLWPGGNIVEWAADNGLSCRMGPYGDARLEVGK